MAQDGANVTGGPESVQDQCTLQPPPGLAGEISNYVYRMAYRSVPEVAVAASLGLLSGIAGREWLVSNSGLNTYLILVARSTIGKEAMLEGISRLLGAAMPIEPRIQACVDFSDFASGPALTKAIAANSCFVNVVGEWGHKFSAMAKGKAEAMNSLRREITNLYAKSGAGAQAGGIRYSNSDQNIGATARPAYSILGETTPSTLYKAMTTEMMADGFMSRFTIIPYDGDRPPKNSERFLEPPHDLSLRLAGIARHSFELRSRGVAMNVGGDELLNDFEQEMDLIIPTHRNDDTRRQMYGRAHLKALRVAALLAVADNCVAPRISREQAEWAVALVRRDIATFTTQLETGGIGDGDDARKDFVKGLIKEYLATKLQGTYVARYSSLHAEGIIPYAWIQNRTQRVPAFEGHPLKATAALKQTLQLLQDSGDLAIADKLKVSQHCSFGGVCYYTRESRAVHWLDGALERINALKNPKSVNPAPWKC